ncbi:MAG: leucine--tRNA ligase [Candidatus Micrarchaeaceae archaeon]
MKATSKYGEIENKWRKAWEEAKIFEPEVSNKESIMVTVAFPYTNAPQHLGHVRTYGTGDAFARYMRMRGYNVLFPMGFHGTGTPILAMAKRMKEQDKELINEYKVFHISEEDMEKMTDPLFIANFFKEELKKGMKLMGYSIDWRRDLFSLDPHFSKFVEWQFKLLSERGYLTKGTHPVGWCPHDNNPVGMHDVKGDVDPEIEEEIAIKFKVSGEESYFLCLTYRPETIYGVTNLFVKRNGSFVEAEIKGESFYISKGASENLSFQVEIKVKREVSYEEIISKKAINPETGEEIMVLPADFVEEDEGSGIVMGVPAHAPYDLDALKKACREMGIEIKPRKVIELKDELEREVGDIPAEYYTKRASSLDEATEMEYREESRHGVISTGKYKGMGEREGREKITRDMLNENKGMMLYVIANSPVICRCGTKISVKILKDQWFIDYSNPEWKKAAIKCLENMKVFPENSKKALAATIEWLDKKAVARSQGLGTKFPFDENYIIESLSDSTIYPALYTIYHYIKSLNPEQLKPQFFDYVFRGIGAIEEVSKLTGISYETIKKCRESFEYWYRYTSRHSASELIYNHLTMYIFNHVCIFKEKYWPKQIVTNGMVLYEGKKMSKSLGNIIPIVDVVERYGADVARFGVVTLADLFADISYTEKEAQGIDEKFSYLLSLPEKISRLGGKELKEIDLWLYSRLNKKIKEVTESMERLEFREAGVNILYNSILELKRYFERGGENQIVLRDYVSNLALMLQPFAPFVAEELWHRLGNSTFASTESWPIASENMINGRLEMQESIIDEVIDDTSKVKSLFERKGNKARKARLIVASQWKRELYRNVSLQIDEFIELAKSKVPHLKEEEIKEFFTNAKRFKEQKEIFSEDEEYKFLNDAKRYIESKCNIEVQIERENAAKEEKARFALPGRPAIIIE